MKIIYVTDFFSEKMGYSENCLPKAMASLGQEVHVITSNLQVYGNLTNYVKTYGHFLGPRIQPCGMKRMNGYSLYRLPHRLNFGYVSIYGLLPKIRQISPDIVQVTSCISTSALKLAVMRNCYKFKLYTECHQHMSIIKPYLRQHRVFSAKRLLYFLTRTVPGWIINLYTEKCFPISPDCAEVANRYYGVEKEKIRISSLGTDTELFVPIYNDSARRQRLELRQHLRISDSDVVCVYSGRFSADKNPLLLAHAVEELRKQGLPYRAVFIGDGVQKNEIEKCQGCIVVPFIPYVDLPKYYRGADIGVWPTQESLSMLDAASCGIPVVVSNQIGELERVEGSGKVYKEGSVEELISVLRSLFPQEIRSKLGEFGRDKMVKKYSWLRVAEKLLQEYQSSFKQD
jgi:glycosyltransferase involved in cell wall biosynthesis